MKFFSIDGRFDVIAIGSLLDVDINGKDSKNAPIPNDRVRITHNV